LRRENQTSFTGFKKSFAFLNPGQGGKYKLFNAASGSKTRLLFYDVQKNVVFLNTEQKIRGNYCHKRR